MDTKLPKQSCGGKNPTLMERGKWNKGLAEAALLGCQESRQREGSGAGSTQSQGSPCILCPPAQGGRPAQPVLQVCRELGDPQAAGALLPSMCAPDGLGLNASQYGILFIITIITILIT